MSAATLRNPHKSFILKFTAEMILLRTKTEIERTKDCRQLLGKKRRFGHSNGTVKSTIANAGVFTTIFNRRLFFVALQYPPKVRLIAEA